MAELLVAGAAAAGLYTIMNDNNNNGGVIKKKENFSNQLPSYSTLNKKHDTTITPVMKLLITMLINKIRKNLF